MISQISKPIYYSTFPSFFNKNVMQATVLSVVTIERWVVRLPANIAVWVARQQLQDRQWWLAAKNARWAARLATAIIRLVNSIVRQTIGLATMITRWATTIGDGDFDAGGGGKYNLEGVVMVSAIRFTGLLVATAAIDALLARG